MKSTRRYNWHPDQPDARDFRYSEKVTAPIKIPKQADLRPRCSPVFNQGKIGSCTANALAGALEFLELQQLKIDTHSPEPEVFSKNFESISRLFIYYNERELEGTVDQDAGASLRDGIKTLAKIGACREKLWDYSVDHVFTQPPTSAYQEAANHKILAYLKLETLDQIRQCLSEGSPVAFGFRVFESFESLEVAHTGLMPVPKVGERELGGHAVLAVGYDDTAQTLLVRNSWGPEWGEKGYFRMPYEIVARLGMARDFWTIQR